jgi:hypothetical protein
MIGFFGAAGLVARRVERGARRAHRARLGSTGLSWGMPTSSTRPTSPISRRPPRTSTCGAACGGSPRRPTWASRDDRALRVHGPAPRPGGIVRKNYVFAKISRPETARRFMMPAPRRSSTRSSAGQLTRRGGRAGRARAGGRRRHRRGRLGRPHRQPAARRVPGHPAPARRAHARARLHAAHPRGRRRRPRHARVRGGGLRARRGLCAHRLGEPGRAARAASVATASSCSRRRPSATSSWPRRPTCSSWGSRCRCSSAARCSGHARSSSTRSTPGTRARRHPRRRARPLEKQILGQPWTRSWAGHARRSS